MYDIVLIEKPGELGLTKAKVMDMYDSLNGDEAYPIEIYNCSGESSAMGFISTAAAETIDYDYEASGLNTFVGKILEDTTLESPLGVYEFKELKIFLTR